MSKPDIHACPVCGQELPIGLPIGLCPRCALHEPIRENQGGATDTIQSAQPGDHIGRYKLLQQIGEGGCGVVFMAEQEEPIRRKVAFKVIKLGMDTKAVIARFEAERQALALMDHPNIAKVLDAGATEAGRPYFVMELVRGVRITDYCDQHNLTTRARLDLFTQVCHAIQHAHQKGIIHRDIKPSNILVTLHDGVPVPKVIDFGIAKATSDQRLTDKTLFTAFEQFMGTPAYMSPEQAEMSGLDIDTRSDIYSLGVLLYELLTGKTPFDGKQLLASGLDAMRRTIREVEPQRPSTRLSTMLAPDLTIVAKHRQTEASKLSSLIDGDLDWIVMKALEKDRSRRYETANGLTMDIKRHLNNEPIAARPPSSFYRFQKAVSRNRLGFLAGSAVAAALLMGAIVSRVQAIKASEQEKLAKEAQALAQIARREAESERDRAMAEKNGREKVIKDILRNFQAWTESDLEPGRYKPIAWPGRMVVTAVTALGRVNAQKFIDAVIRNNPGEIEGWNSKVPYLLFTEDIPGYIHGCRELLRLFPAEQLRTNANAYSIANKIVKSCLLGPGALSALTPSEREAFNDLMKLERGLSAHENLHYQRWSFLNFGLAAYREAEFSIAVSELERCISGTEEPIVRERTAAAQTLLAMASQRSGDKDAARRWLEKAATEMKPILAHHSWENVSEDGLRYLVLRREAEELIWGSNVSVIRGEFDPDRVAPHSIQR